MVRAPPVMFAEPGWPPESERVQAAAGTPATVAEVPATVPLPRKPAVGQLTMIEAACTPASFTVSVPALGAADAEDDEDDDELDDDELDDDDDFVEVVALGAGSTRPVSFCSASAAPSPDDELVVVVVGVVVVVVVAVVATSSGSLFITT